jgi:hypothetical protein
LICRWGHGLDRFQLVQPVANRFTNLRFNCAYLEQQMQHKPTEQCGLELERKETDV